MDNPLRKQLLPGRLVVNKLDIRGTRYLLLPKEPIFYAKKTRETNFFALQKQEENPDYLSMTHWGSNHKNAFASRAYPHAQKNIYEDWPAWDLSNGTIEIFDEEDIEVVSHDIEYFAEEKSSELFIGSVKQSIKDVLAKLHQTALETQTPNTEFKKDLLLVLAICCRQKYVEFNKEITDVVNKLTASKKSCKVNSIDLEKVYNQKSTLSGNSSECLARVGDSRNE